MKIRHALAGLLAVIAVAGAVPTASQAASGTAAPAAADPTCPAPGHRIKWSDDPTVYLIGPGGHVYDFPNSTTYFALYSSYSGITTVSSSVIYRCLADSYGQNFADDLTGTQLVKKSGTSAVYIWDASYGGYRWITSQAIFNKYGFDSSKIRAVSSVGPVTTNWWE